MSPAGASCRRGPGSSSTSRGVRRADRSRTGPQRGPPIVCRLYPSVHCCLGFPGISDLQTLLLRLPMTTQSFPWAPAITHTPAREAVRVPSRRRPDLTRDQASVCPTGPGVMVARSWLVASYPQGLWPGRPPPRPSRRACEGSRRSGIRRRVRLAVPRRPQHRRTCLCHMAEPCRARPAARRLPTLRGMAPTKHRAHAAVWSSARGKPAASAVTPEPPRTLSSSGGRLSPIT